MINDDRIHFSSCCTEIAMSGFCKYVFVVLFQCRLSWKQVLNVVDTVSSVMLGTVVAFVIHASSMICSSHD